MSKEEKRSDYVFENVRDGKILLSNSFCDEFQEGTLEALALKTFQTIAEFKIQQQGYLTFQEREAFEVSGVGKVDGVTVKLQLLNTRRNNCYFDFLSITPERSKDGEGAFRNFLKAVVFK